MCKTEKLFVTLIQDQLESINRDIHYLIDNESKNKDKLIWAQAKINDLARLLDSIKQNN